jgi:hypothetical protein
MSRGHHRHLLARRETRPYEFDAYEPGKTPYWADAEFVIALCGQEYRVSGWGADSVIEDRDYVTCPACRRKKARQELRARPAGAAVLTMEQDKEAKGGFRYQQGWKALVNGVQVAILGYEDHGWRIYPLRAFNDDQERGLHVRNAYHPIDDEGLEAGRTRDYRLPSSALNFRTKEEALMACEDLRARGKLKTAPERLHAYAEAVRRRDAWAKSERTRVETAEQNRLETLEALNEILEKETLSNFQRQGLMTAIARFEKKPDADS